MSRRLRALCARPIPGWPWLATLGLVAVAGCQADRLPTEPAAESQPEEQLSAAAATVGADDWIVVFKKGTQDPPGLAKRLTTQHGGSVKRTYSHAIQGFAGRIPAQAIEAIRHNPNVDLVERDGVVRKTAVGSWGLDRIDQRDLPLDNDYSAAWNGSGVDVYIIDTGIDYATYSGGAQFGSRLDQGRDVDFVDDDDDASDCDGHGTHVAGTVGSTGYGVAPGVTLIGVRVLSCSGSGSYSDVIAGIDYVAANATGPSVANMSLGGGYSSALNSAVNSAVAAGVVFAVSSGNSNTDACNQSPASAASAITVNASTSSDARSSFSNYGTCTDIFAPGSSIRSTIMGGGTQSWSGTSMASPHVAGVAALILDEDGSLTVGQVWDRMSERATRDRISNAGSGSPNLLLYSGSGSGGDPGCGTSCPTLDVRWISSVSVQSNRNRRANGTVTVEIVDSDGPVSGVAVSGSWKVNGIADYTSSSGTTGTDGRVALATGNIRNAASFELCVTGLSKSGYEDGSEGTECSPYGSPWDGGGGEPPPDAGAEPPANLTGSSSKKGRNWRADLSWTDGGATVDIRRNGSVRATVSNSGSYTDNVGKNPSGSYSYQVCNAGSTGECSAPVTVNF
jgi:serine protease